MGIDTDSLLDDSVTDLWTNREYQLDEWRVFRDTGINPRKIVNVFRNISSSLCVSERIMLEIQYAWLDAYLPMQWWDNMHRQYMRCPYSELLLTDVNQPQFKLQVSVGLSLGGDCSM